MNLLRRLNPAIFMVDWRQHLNFTRLSAIFRVALSALPLALRSSCMNMFSALSSSTILAAIMLPLALIAAVFYAYTERTPISERLRPSLLSSAEEEHIRSSFLSNTPHADARRSNEAKWYHILRKVKLFCTELRGTC